MSISENMCPALQSRWKLEERFLKYYGLRNYPYTLQRTVRLSASEAWFVKSLDGRTTFKELSEKHKLTRRLFRLMNEAVIVDVNSVKKIPGSMEEARYCIKCIANDFIIPGLEFDDTGKCALCQAEENITGQISTPMATFTGDELAEKARNNTKSRFDVALMFTGGKDSSFLLYYLAKVCKLRILACTWMTPYMSPNAKTNIKSAKERLTNVEFIERSIMPEHLDAMYKASLRLQGNTCLCPALAYVVFYPVLAAERIPYVISGIEEVQHKNLILNGFIPLYAFKLSSSPAVHAAMNFFRIITLRPPYKKGQMETAAYFKQLAFGDNLLKRVSGYRNEMVDHLHAAFKTVPGVLAPLVNTLRKVDRNGNIPVFANLNFNAASPGGVYDWDAVKKILQDELGWKGTGECESDKGLHTSCIVEDGKDYSQFIRFRNMESMIIPFSAVELSTAVSSGNTTREKAMRELRQMPGFDLEPPRGYKLMHCCDGLPCSELCGVYEKTHGDGSFASKDK